MGVMDLLKNLDFFFKRRQRWQYCAITSLAYDNIPYPSLYFASQLQIRSLNHIFTTYSDKIVYNALIIFKCFQKGIIIKFIIYLFDKLLQISK